jgi:arginine decarboxylase
MDLNAQGVRLPLLLRFSDILRTRIEQLSERFQQRDPRVRVRGPVHDRLPDQGQPAAARGRGDPRVRRPYGVGIEVGSKPELQAALALSDRTDHMIVCNGYKDEEFMRLALMGQKLGHRS